MIELFVAQQIFATFPDMSVPESESKPALTPSASALVALRRIVKAVEAHARRLARDTSLTPSQVGVLKDLSVKAGAQPGELARSSGLKQATISILLDRLQERGLVLRARGDADRRTVVVQITPEGRRTLAETPDLLQTEFADRFDRLPDWEQAYLNAALLRLVTLLDASDVDASPVLDVGAVHELPSDPAD